jgi:Arc/MetJ-type ribon-helix-helix transcriptional regulator
MADTKRVNVTMDEQLLERVDSFAKENYEDRSTAIRQLLAFALTERNKKKVLEGYADGRLTLREAAELLGVDYWELQSILAEAGVPVSSLTPDEIRETSRENDV